MAIDNKKDPRYDHTQDRARYIVVGGNPFRGYNGTMTYTGLSIVGKADSMEEAGKIVNEKYDQCAGLLLVIDTWTGKGE